MPINCTSYCQTENIGGKWRFAHFHWPHRQRKSHIFCSRHKVTPFLRESLSQKGCDFVFGAYQNPIESIVFEVFRFLMCQLPWAPAVGGFGAGYGAPTTRCALLQMRWASDFQIQGQVRMLVQLRQWLCLIALFLWLFWHLLTNFESVPFYK